MYQHLAQAFFLTSIITLIDLRALASNVLISSPSHGKNSMNLTAGQYLNASHFYLVMQPDCNLVTYNGSTPFLTTKLDPAPLGSHCYATLQANGDFVINQRENATSEVAIWSSKTPAWSLNSSTRFTTFRYMILGRDGNLSMYGPDNRLLTDVPLFVPINEVTPPQSFPPDLEWKPTMPLVGYPYMPAEYFLTQDSRLQTVDKRFILKLGPDCKLQSQEIWNGNNTVKRVVWEPDQRRVSNGSCELRLRQDGLLEIRDIASGVVHWNSSVRGDASVNWVLKLNANDGHVSVSDILNLSNVLWKSSDVLKDQSADAALWPIVVGMLGGSVVVAMAAFAFWILYIRPRFRDPAERDFQRRLESIGGKAQALSEVVITRATNNFGCRIGYGGFGDVFYGRLTDGQEIAAKVLTARSLQSKEEFYNEIELLSVVHHKYLVSLLGYSSSRKHQVLIYEYMGGGDLRHRLQGYGAARNPLSWRQRISIILQVAEGLEYLHDKCTPAIIHRDVKSNNILLTANCFVAKVADFGLSKLRRKDQESATHITTVVKGTPGYLDPEYHETGMLTEKSDVYAFGIVLMEILTGQHHMSISEGVSEARKLKQYEGLADPNLKGDFDREGFVSLVDLSLWCASKNHLRRPYMREVVQKLREIGIAPIDPDSVQREGNSSGESQSHRDMDFEHTTEAGSHYVTSFSGFLEFSSSLG